MGTLQLPYAMHPAFLAASTATVDAAIADAFSASYRRLEGSLAASARRSTERQAAASLAQIWTQLETVGDADFRALIDELRDLTAQRLAADLEYFAARRPATNAGQLALDRYSIAQLSSDTLAKLQAIAAEPLVDLRANAARGRVTRDDLSINTGAVARDLVYTLGRELERSGIHDAVSAYAGRSMRTAGVALELSVPVATWWRNQYELARPPRTLYAHTDEGLANPKAIVYLTDVDAHAGPTSMFPHCEDELDLTPLQKLVGRVINSVAAPGSPLRERFGLSGDARPFASKAFRRHFANLPAAVRYNSHFGWDVVPDSELERMLVAAEVPIVGPAGTYVVFDGARIIHRGGMVERGDRVALQVVFAEPPSRFVAAAGRLAASGRAVLANRSAIRSELRELRVRVGRTVQRYSRDPHHRLVREVAKLLPAMACIDIGASYYAHPPWDVFRASPLTAWIAVEPNRQNTAYLDTWPWAARPKLVATGLSERGGEQTLHVTNVDSGSSLLPPLIHPDMAHRVVDHSYFFPVTERAIATKTLDEVAAELDGPLVVKLDTQGTELAILRGGPTALARTVAIESEATLLANPTMAGAGKFWEMCQFLEARGFELLQLKPIEGGAARPKSVLARRTYLNECDAVFCLTRSELARRGRDAQLVALGIYLSYHLYEEARALADAIGGIDSSIAKVLEM
ncbi:MAG TPA: FkbM family methyltransferase [Kofleriaceae bacterium]|jgi:FkbM family methyltransferase